MRLATILPPAFGEACLRPKDNYHLLIAPLVLEDPLYREFYHERLKAGDFVMLDNGAYEAHTYNEESNLSPEFLESAVNTLGVLPAEIVLPDVPGSAHETLMASTKAAYHLREVWRYCQFMAVPHAQTLEEYHECVRYIVKLPGLTSLGVPFIAADVLNIDRSALVRTLNDQVLSSHRTLTGKRVAVHLLGYKDPIPSETVKLCRGVDTSKHVRMAMEGRALSTENPTIECGPRPQDFFTQVPDDVSTTDRVTQNIEAMEEIINEQ